jgi:hypothetical protein
MGQERGLTKIFAVWGAAREANFDLQFTGSKFKETE